MRRVLLIAVGLALLPASSAGAQQWSGNRAPIPGPPVSVAGIALADSGETLALLHRPEGLAVSVRPPGGAFGEPHAFAGEVSDEEVAFAARPDGAAIAVWHHRSPASDSITELRYAARAPGGAFSQPTAVPGSADAYRGPPVVAFDGAGGAVVAWIRVNQQDPQNRDPHVLTATYRDGAFGPIQTLGRGASIRELTIAVNRGGEALIAWGEIPQTGQGRLHATLRLRGSSTFPPAGQIGPDAWSGAFSISPALTSDGGAAIVWLQHVTSSLDEPHALVALRPAGSAQFGTPAVVARSLHEQGNGRPLQQVRGAYGAGGRYHVLLTRGGRGHLVQGVSSSPGTTTFSAPVQLGEVVPDANGVVQEHVEHLRLLTVGQAGAVYAFPAGGFRGGFVDAAGAWRAPTTLAAPPEYPVTEPKIYLAVNGAGSGAAIFRVDKSDPADPLDIVVSDFTAGPAGPLALPVDRVAPRLRRARMVRGAFRVGARSGFRFTLSEPARVRIELRRVRARRASGALTRSLKAGAHRITFRGRIGRKALRRGRYRARLVATDAAGNRSRAATVTFRLVR